MKTAEAVSPHTRKFADKLGAFPNVQPTLDRAANPENQDEVAKTFLQYRSLIKAFVHMSERDIALSTQVNAAKVTKGAETLLAQLGDKREELIKLVDSVLDPESPEYVAGLQELQAMMQKGQKIFDDKRKPKDGDPESDAAIWGFTQVGPEYIQTHRHFLVIHFLQRFLAQTFRTVDAEIAKHKDYLIAAIQDALIIEHLRHGRFNEIFDVWQKAKTEGGLGWVKENRLNLYREALAKEEA